MPDIHIERAHALGLTEARALAERWVHEAETQFDMTCTWERGEAEDCVNFTRAGASGTLSVSADRFALDAKLGFLLGQFKDRVEAEIGKNLDALLASKSP